MKDYQFSICFRQLFLMCVISLFIMPFNSVSQNSNYISNKSPLIDVPFTELPIGVVKADGWLLKQLQLQKEGLTGNAEILYNDSNDLGPNSNWLGGKGESWERAPYYVKGIVALAYVLNDKELISKSQKWIDWSINSQKANGYFGPDNNNDWWARMPMLYAIRDYYEATKDLRVIPFFTKYFQYQMSKIDTQPLSDWGQSRAGDNIEIVFWLYNRTGNQLLLELADKLEKQAFDWTDIFSNNRFFAFQQNFQPKHNVNIPEAMKLPAIYYQKSQSKSDRAAYVKGRSHLMCDHGQPYGMQSGNEMISGKSAMTGVELCSIVEQMQSAETAQMILGDATIGDQLEKVAFNALPGSMTKDLKGFQYYTQANQVKSIFGNYSFGQQYNNGILPGPTSGYQCCRFNLHMGWPYFVKALWAATSDNGLAAMAYGPSHLTAKVGAGVDVTIQEETNYPFAEQLNFTLTTTKSVSFPLKLRIPAWCATPQVVLNGKVLKGAVSGSFYTIHRTWHNNDKLSLLFPMKLMLNNEVNNSVSIQRGPLIYSLKIDEQWSTKREFANGFKEYEVLPLSAWNYALVLNNDNLDATIKVHKAVMPENPFVQATTPVTLSVSSKKISSWEYALNDIFACDPPYGPIQSSQKTEEITMVPFGTETLRATCLPVIGQSSLVTNKFKDDFSNEKQTGWINYNGSFQVDKGEYLATNTEGYDYSKSVVSSTFFSDFTFDAKVMVSADGNGGLIFRANRFSFGVDEFNGYYVGISAKDKTVILGKENGKWNLLTSTKMVVEANRWYQVRIVANKTEFKIFVEDMSTPKIIFNDNSFSKGSIGVKCFKSITRWDNISVLKLISSRAPIRL
jgi:hypothetical protein